MILYSKNTIIAVGWETFIQLWSVNDLNVKGLLTSKHTRSITSIHMDINNFCVWTSSLDCTLCCWK